jgi:hypothetical protein
MSNVEVGPSAVITLLRLPWREEQTYRMASSGQPNLSNEALMEYS